MAVAEKHIVFTVRVGPFAWVIPRRPAPIVVFGPCRGEIQIGRLSCGTVGLHVADMVDGTVPKIIAVCGIGGHPVLVHFVYDVGHVVLAG